MNKLLMGFCGFMLLINAATGSIHSWIIGAGRSVLAGIALLLLWRLLQNNAGWQTKIPGVLGAVFLVFTTSVGIDFATAASVR